ncbi:hypothetical protein E4U55_002815 [Claviceps digitariae]|nr:hypothetical protein E4U55_002815 [Claviceps digitariae]
MLARLPVRLGHLPCTGLGSQGRRCISYDKAALTDEALQNQIEAGLNNGDNGEKIRVNQESKTISTAVGELPISPLFDADWMRARRRQRKDDAGKPTGRFRKKLAKNPFAQALATPIRQCPRTLAFVPRYFLQEFEQVKHPSTDSLWWAPGPLAFQNLQTRSTSPASSPSDLTSSPPRNRSPITAYVLSRKYILDKLGGGTKKEQASIKTQAPVLFSTRTGTATAFGSLSVIWRQDMSDVVLNMMRCHATDALIALSTHEQTCQALQPCKWEEVGDVTLRGCVLWLRGEDEPAAQIATMNVDGAKYGQKIAVYDLKWLLGESEIHRLRTESETFTNHDVLVLRQEKSKSRMALHLLLWRLQGFLMPSTRSKGRA